MRRIGASEFKAKCLAILDEVYDSGARIVISKHGKPVAELSRYGDRQDGSPQESLHGTARLGEDIEAPAVGIEQWEAARES